MLLLLYDTRRRVDNEKTLTQFSLYNFHNKKNHKKFYNNLLNEF